MNKVTKVAIVTVGVMVGLAVSPVIIKTGKKAWSWYQKNYLTMPDKSVVAK